MHICLAIEIEDDDSEDQSLIELAGEILEESFVTDIKPDRLEFPDSILLLEAILDGVLTAVRDEGGFEVPTSTFLFKELKGDLPTDKLLLEDVEVADLVLVDADGPEGDLDDSVGLGRLPREPPVTEAFATEVTLSEEVK